MADKIKNIKGSLILLLAAFIWGTAFVAQTSGADSVGTFTFNTCRSVVGALFLLLVIVLLDSYGKRTSGGGKDTLQEPYSRTKWPVKGGVLCGIILFVAMSLQQYGIGIYPAGVAASGRAGFLTATYVVLVAICSVWMGKKLHPLIAVSIVGCIAGMYLLCMSGGFAGIYMGDVCEFLCAVGFMCHILTVEHLYSVCGMCYTVRCDDAFYRKCRFCRNMCGRTSDFVYGCIIERNCLYLTDYRTEVRTGFGSFDCNEP